MQSDVTAPMTSNDTLYVVTGIDPQGREFCGLYTEDDARYLSGINCLNKVLDRTTGAVIQFTH